MDLSEKVVKLDIHLMDECYKMYTKNPTIRQARQLIFAKIFENGITLTSPEKKNFVVNQGFQEILDIYYLDFAQAVLDDYFMFGFSNFFLAQITTKDKKKMLVPRKLDYGSYTVSIKSKPFAESELVFNVLNHDADETFANFFFKNKNKNKNKKEEITYPKIYPIVFDRISLPNIHNGTINSIVSTLLSTYKYNEVLLKFNLQATYINSFPKLITKTRNDKSKVAASSSNDFDKSNLVDNDIIHFKEKQRNNLVIQSMSNMLDCQQPAKKYIKIEDDRIDLMDLQENIFQLPHDVELASSNLPHIQNKTELLDFQIHKDRITLVSFGIPVSLAVGRDVSLKNNTKLNEEEAKNFFKNVRGYANLVENAVQKVFDIIYPNNTKVKNENSETEETEKENSETEENFKQYISISIYNDCLKLETVKMLYEYSAIDEVEKIKLMRLSAGLNI
jgi:hypothetical protein